MQSRNAPRRLVRSLTGPLTRSLTRPPTGPPTGPPSRPVRRPRLASFVPVALVAALLAGCSPTAGRSTTTDGATADVSPGNTLTWGWYLPTSWDPVTSTAGQDVHALALVYDALVQQEDDGDARPGLAESWTYNETGDQVTFHLRDGLTFTDGTPLDAEAVKANLLRGRDQPNSTIAAQLSVITDVTVDSPTDVTLHLDQPDFQIPLLLAGKNGMQVSPAAFGADVDAIATAPVGSGPFTLTEYVPDSHAAVVKNEEYWNADAILLGGVDLRPTPDPTVAVAGIRSGQYGLAVVPPAQVAAAEQAGLTVEEITAFTVRVIDVDATVAPYDDPRVLQAISHALDRQALVDVSFFGRGSPNWQPFPDGYVAYDDDLDELYEFDQDAARALLAEAGHAKGLDLTLTIGTAVDQALAEQIQSQLAEVGITVTIQMATPGTSNYVTREYPFYLDSFSGRESPVQALEVLFGPEGLMNLGRTSPPDLQPAIDAVRAVPLDDPAYPGLLQEAVSTAVTQMPNTFLFTWPRIFVHDDRVRDFRHQIGTVRFEGVWVEAS
ncbi:ABC transporter substrate-binding protein [Cellulomonas fimi]|uniref:ABC transporter substrate-binding protein n=1 Tax=Cellulomonas fimi TaxID=1708 RepID=A0A7Y0LZ02_CELFI|nr:ABC transporter substrate-binding protein [Cellulomonas fimi]NMR20511.1 ABC transporter substrate-binding protein [Cellulomonas fimi]